MIRMPDGGFYVAHTTGTYVVVSKLLSNGLFDNSFFNKGYTMFPSGFTITSLSVKPNGDVVTGGTGFNESASMPSVGFVTFKTNGDLQLVSNATQFPLGTSMETSIPVGAADDPKFIAAGSKIVNGKPHVFIQKYNPDDTADHLIVTPWLGKNGISAIPTAITKYYSSHYLVAANMIGPNEDTVAVILKYNLDGTIDPSFGQNGACYLYAIQAGQGWADVVQFPDGKYLAGGTATYISNDANKRAIVLNKFLEDGRPDSSFGEYGRLYAQVSTSSRTGSKLHAYPDGSFLVYGTIQNGLYNNTSITCVYKFLADGSPDASFGMNGVRWLGNMDNEDFLATDTAIYVAGSNGSTARSQVIKMTPDGNVSRGYSMGSRYFDAMGINPISGSVFIGTGYTAAANVVYKSMENGTIDADFGVNGYALLTAIPDGTSSSPAWIRQIKTNPAGVIMVVRVWQATSGPSKPQAIYFNWITPDGKVDSSTGGLGTKKLIIPNTSSIVAEKYQWIENGNKLLIFGQAVVNGITKGMIAKVTTSGNLDASFGTGGVIWSNSVFGGIYNFNRSGDIISIINNGLLGGSSLAKMDVPFTVYHTMKAAAWTGGVSNDWFNPANWSENEVPDANTVVVIATGNCNIPANMHAVAYSVEVKSGAYFTIGGNASLTVTSVP